MLKKEIERIMAKLGYEFDSEDSYGLVYRRLIDDEFKLYEFIGFNLNLNDGYTYQHCSKIERVRND